MLGVLVGFNLLLFKKKRTHGIQSDTVDQLVVDGFRTGGVQYYRTGFIRDHDKIYEATSIIWGYIWGIGFCLGP